MKTKKGFTLVEVVVSTAILALMALMLFVLYGTSNKVSWNASSKRLETNTGSQALQQWNGVPNAEVTYLKDASGNYVTVTIGQGIAYVVCTNEGGERLCQMTSKAPTGP
ncbi:MAG: PulJ/GspJ family protein [Erysipelotrichaceae bacterium]